jgi:ADP-heptose:LPS heptosyltransferase
MHLDLLRYLVGPVVLSEPEVSVSAENRKKIKLYLEEKGIKENDFVIGINLGGEGERRWKWENYFELADWIVAELKYKVIFIWGPKEKELLSKIPENSKNKIIVAELFPLPVLAALLERCNLFVSCDTGPMHLSYAVGTPTLAIFLASDQDKFGPRGEKHRIVFSDDGKVSMEMVKKALLEMIEKSITQNSSTTPLCNERKR